MRIIIFLFLAQGALVVLMISYFRGYSRKVHEKLKNRLEAMRRTVQEKKESLLQNVEENALLERRVLEIIELYELTKKASASLEFREVFGILSQTLNANFSFARGYLFLFREGGQTSQEIDCIYDLKFHGNGNSQEDFLVTMAPETIAGLTQILEDAAEKKEAFRKGPFLMMPLQVKGRLIAMIALEAAVPEDSEKLTILSRQFALAIEKVKLYGKIQELAITDGLTRLRSRRYFLERFLEELARSKRRKLSLSFLMADIDHFKQKNDQYGHLVGDVILREVATLLKENVREIDLVGRYGGEEFSIVLPDTGMSEAIQVADRIRNAVAQKTFTAYDEVTRVTISIGVGTYPDDGEEAVALIEAADSALYHAKQSGRNRVSARATPSQQN
ncbi:MAG: sensor domain-containing diguanylate cyclase [Candidatus Omnitrophota bacterium]